MGHPFDGRTSLVTASCGLGGDTGLGEFGDNHNVRLALLFVSREEFFSNLADRKWSMESQGIAVMETEFDMRMMVLDRHRLELVNKGEYIDAGFLSPA